MTDRDPFAQQGWVPTTTATEPTTIRLERQEEGSTGGAVERRAGAHRVGITHNQTLDDYGLNSTNSME